MKWIEIAGNRFPFGSRKTRSPRLGSNVLAFVMPTKYLRTKYFFWCTIFEEKDKEQIVLCPN